ncbi:prolyl oligopeptidase family serine peptidase [Acidobacteria bacterium AH-259-D05]|nr:prolyl oligopeptidase family serine peptidase [Acidobacteria bacterium AH-259-D05]
MFLKWRRLVLGGAIILLLAAAGFAAYSVDRMALFYLRSPRRLPFPRILLDEDVSFEGRIPGYANLGRSRPSDNPPGFQIIRPWVEGWEIGIRRGDIVTSVAGATYRDSQQLAISLIHGHEAEEVLPVVVQRDEEVLHKDLRLKPFLRSPADLNLPFEDIELNSASGFKLRGWFIPPPEWSDQRAAVFVHGARATRYQGLGGASHWHRRGYGLLMMDLSGQGSSEGVYVTYTVKERLDVASMMDWLRQHPAVSSDRVVLFGTSNGASAAIYAASKDPLLPALALDAPFSDLWATASESGVNSILLYLLAPAVWLRAGMNLSEIRPGDVITQIQAPVLFIHGDADREVLPYHSQHMAEARQKEGLPTEMWLIPGGQHGFDDYPPPPVFWNRVLDFYDEVLGAPSLPGKSVEQETGQEIRN